VPTHVALLRGINVGGRNRVAMAALREVVEGLGHTGVATYIQSGNVVFTSEETDTATLAAALERAIADQLGVQPKVVVLTREQLAQVVADNPFPKADNPRQLHALFWNGPLGPEELAAVATAQRQAREGGGRDEAKVVGTTLYLHPGRLRPQRAGREAGPDRRRPDRCDGRHRPQLGDRAETAGHVRQLRSAREDRLGGRRLQ
jgi:uncharacterized protein (DUF1697 family)